MVTFTCDHCKAQMPDDGTTYEYNDGPIAVTLTVQGKEKMLRPFTMIDGGAYGLCLSCAVYFLQHHDLPPLPAEGK